MCNKIQRAFNLYHALYMKHSNGMFFKSKEGERKTLRALRWYRSAIKEAKLYETQL